VSGLRKRTQPPKLEEKGEREVRVHVSLNRVLNRDETRILVRERE